MTAMENPLIASVEEVGDDEIEACVTFVTDATRKGTGTALRELAKNGVLNRQNIERVCAHGNEIVAAITALVNERIAELAENITGYVKLISGAETLELDETDGKAIIAKAEDIFLGHIDDAFIRWGCDVESEPTQKTQVTVHEMVKDGTLIEIWTGISDDPNSLCLTQSQIIQFVEKHKKWLRSVGYVTFSLFKVGNEFFVACVRFDGAGQLGVFVHRLSFDIVWYAVHGLCFVVPQLALAN